MVVEITTRWTRQAICTDDPLRGGESDGGNSTRQVDGGTLQDERCLGSPETVASTYPLGKPRHRERRDGLDGDCLRCTRRKLQGRDGVRLDLDDHGTIPSDHG